jgi:thiol-disulfide isomerase/thioredoxin
MNLQSIRTRIPPIKSWLIFAAGFASCIGSLAVLGLLLYTYMLKPMQEEMMKSGNMAPPRIGVTHPASYDLAFTDKNGTALKLESYRGKVIILNFWGTWCGPCMKELPSLGALAARYAGDEDVAVLCLSEESAKEIYESKAAQASKAPIFSYHGQTLPAAYQSTGIPATFVIDKEGRIVSSHIGLADWSAASFIEDINQLK